MLTTNTKIFLVEVLVVITLAFIGVTLALALRASVKNTQIQLRENELWCQLEVARQANEVEREIYVDELLQVYDVCTSSVDEFPMNAFQATSQ